MIQKFLFKTKLKAIQEYYLLDKKERGLGEVKQKKVIRVRQLKLLKLDITTIEILYLLFDVIEVWGMNLGYK